MKASDLLADQAVQGEIQVLAQRFGLSEQQAHDVLASVMPEVTRKLERLTLSRGGVADLVAMLGASHAEPTDLTPATGAERGNALLEQVFGNRDGSRAVASRAAYASGIGDTMIKAMLPYIIQMVMGAFARKASGGLGDILSKIPNLGGGAGGNIPSGAPRRPTATAPAPSGGGPFSPPDGQTSFPRGGSGSPLPGPEGMELPRGGAQNPYGDLSDIIRRGGRNNTDAAPAEGGTLWRMVRSILGGALGFQSRGVMSWILRYVVLRFGASIVRTIFRRLATGR